MASTKDRHSRGQVGGSAAAEDSGAAVSGWAASGASGFGLGHEIFWIVMLTLSSKLIRPGVEKTKIVFRYSESGSEARQTEANSWSGAEISF
jgi:hypothetical protein